MKRARVTRWFWVSVSVFAASALILSGCQSAPKSEPEIQVPEESVPLPATDQISDLPEPRGWVTDLADVIPPLYEQKITDRVAALWTTTGVEVAVLTVDTFAPFPTIDEYSIAVADAWGVGAEHNDSGVLFTVALEERKVRIEVGYGLQEIIPDDVAGQILDDFVVPYLTAGDFGPGLLAGVEAVADLITSTDTK